MWNYLRTLFGPEPPVLPSPVTITGIRFPSDGSKPHLLTLTTTNEGVWDRQGGDACWGHIPDMRKFWKTERAWQWRDFETSRLRNQPLSACNGLYVLFYSWDLETLPENRNFPEAVFGRERAFAGDAFVVKLQGNEIGEDLGDDGWAAWINVPSEILSLPVMKM